MISSTKLNGVFHIWNSFCVQNNICHKVKVILIFIELHDPNVLSQPLLKKNKKHIYRVLSAHTGPFQGLNMITTDCQNCINNFYFFDTIVYKKIYKSMAASLSLVTLVPPCQWMAATASILAKDVLRLGKKNWAPPCWTFPPLSACCA